MSARFEPPFIQDNPTGWGPNTIPAQFKDMVSDLLSSNLIIIKRQNSPKLVVQVKI